MTLLDAAFPDPPAPTISLPASFESREAIERIIRGLRHVGHTEEQARFGAGIAVLEAPFAPPDEDSWRRCCSRARQVAHEGLPVERDR